MPNPRAQIRFFVQLVAFAILHALFLGTGIALASFN
jgi:hypothetical protein